MWRISDSPGPSVRPISSPYRWAALSLLSRGSASAARQSAWPVTSQPSIRTGPPKRIGRAPPCSRNSR